VVRGPLVSTVWPDILRKILLFGSESRHFHGGQVKEIFNLATVVTDENSQRPKLIPDFGFASRELKEYIRNFLSAKQGREEYTYGSRMRNFLGVNQVKAMIRKIKGYPNDRGALSVLWDPTQDNAPRKVPCLSLVQVNGEGDKLHLTAYFRSNDMFNAWPRNTFALRALQAEIAKKTKKKLGWLTTISNCAHIYENEWEPAQKVAQKYLDEKSFVPDPRGNVLVSVRGSKIVVKQVAQSGADIREFAFDGRRKKAAWAAIQKLLTAEVFGDMRNAADIAIELHKAEVAVKSGEGYEQDKEKVD
jgi:thymidylate synthase